MPRDPTRGPMAVLKENATKALFANRDCLIAQFFRRHPEIDPLDVELHSKMTVDGVRTFWIQVRKRAQQQQQKRIRVGSK